MSLLTIIIITVIIIVIIITLFQEDNIFCTDNVISLSYGPQLTNVDVLSVESRFVF